MRLRASDCLLLNPFFGREMAIDSSSAVERMEVEVNYLAESNVFVQDHDGPAVGGQIAGSKNGTCHQVSGFLFGFLVPIEGLCLFGEKIFECTLEVDFRSRFILFLYSVWMTGNVGK